MRVSETMSRQVLLGFLQAGRVLDGLSSVLLLGTLLLTPLSPLAVVAAAAALGLLEKYFAWRVALDAEFFTLLSEVRPAAPAEFDAALAAFLGRPVPAPRPLPSRIRGGRLLLLRQALALGAQVLAVAAQVVLAKQ